MRIFRFVVEEWIQTIHLWCLIKFGFFFQSIRFNCIQKIQSSQCIRFRCISRNLKTNSDMWHGSKMINFVKLDFCHQSLNTKRICNISIMQFQFWICIYKYSIRWVFKFDDLRIIPCTSIYSSTFSFVFLFKRYSAR